jgi:1-deoxy-D-xylulose-5-phosphate reductoisomerase
VGAAGLPGTLAAARAGKLIALANKESLVVAGHLVRAACHESGAVLLPVDSEHNAIFQALAGHGLGQVRRIVLTASGGPFRGRDRAFLEKVTPAQALTHPNWSMGAKITVDSATLMNKGLELIEARWLFGVDPDRIDVVVHPQSIVHSLVEFVDGTFLAQLGPTDMRLAIQYALTWPERRASDVPRLSLTDVARLDFEAPDETRFPALGLARRALAAGGTLPAVLNAANDRAVAAFADGRIGFLQIPAVVEQVMAAHTPVPATDLGTILEAESWASSEAETRIRRAGTA